MNEIEIWLCKIIVFLIFILLSFFAGIFMGYIMFKK